MELSNTRIVPLPKAAVWSALNDPAVLKDCLPGCEVLEADGDHAWRVVMAARVGPVSARFNGRITMVDIVEPDAYTLQFDGQGGAAGFARGEARINLVPHEESSTAMSYAAKAQIGGKLAQIGSRLVDGAAAKMADDFFARFVTRAGVGRAVQPGNAPAGSAEPEVDGGAQRAVAKPSPLAPPGGSGWIRYAAIAAIIVVLILLYARGYR
jgi:carbon monoxide dehydrogenase subunit G